MKSTSFLLSKCMVTHKAENPPMSPLLMVHRPFHFLCQNYSAVFGFKFQVNPSCTHSTRAPVHFNTAIYINVSVFKIYAIVRRQLTLPHRTIYPSVHLQLEARTDSCSLLLKRYRLINKDRDLQRKEAKQHPLTTIPSPYQSPQILSNF